jgi:SOS-response transcriptional repressor LexA
MVKTVATQHEEDAPVRSLTEWLDASMKARGLSQKDLIARSNLPQPTVSKLMKGTLKVSTTTLPVLEKALQTKAPPRLSAQAVPGRRHGYTDAKVMAAAQASPITGATPQRADRDVQVWLAFTIGKGPLFMLQNAATEFAWRPPSLSSARNAFMLRMHDDSMSPWREPGEPIYFDPDADAATATHAMLQFDLGPPSDVCLICRLLSPPIVGEKANALVYRDGRKSTIPDKPVRRAIPAIEWSQIVPG